MIDWKAFKSQANGNPRKILRFAIGLAACFFVMWAFVLAKTDLSPTSSSDILSMKPEISDSLSEASTYEPSQQIRDLKGIESDQKNSTSMLPVVFLFGLVIVGLWFFSKKKKGLHSQEFMHVMGTQQVGANQQLSLVHINNEYWVLGITNGQVSLLHRYGEHEWNGNHQFGPTESEEQSVHKSFLALLKQEEQAV